MDIGQVYLARVQPLVLEYRRAQARERTQKLRAGHCTLTVSLNGWEESTLKTRTIWREPPGSQRHPHGHNLGCGIQLGHKERANTRERIKIISMIKINISDVILIALPILGLLFYFN